MPRSEIADMIIQACRRRDGRGRTFYRTDGLTDEPRRRAAREAYLNEHPETSPAGRELILKGGVTPGMLKAEVTAAWGLLEEDLGALAGRSTADESHTYEWWSGFDVGERESYELYYTDGVLAGIRVNDSAGPVYEDETSPYDWWSATYQAVRVAEGEGGRVEVVGALVL